jgi:hypothetical protein
VDYPSSAAHSKIIMVNSKKRLKKFFSAVALLMTAMSAMAQSNGAAGITKATQITYKFCKRQLIFAE